MRSLAQTKETTTAWEELRRQLEDLEAHAELAAEALDEKETQDARSGLARLRSRLNLLEIQSKLSGPHDRANAILTLHTGAGGTEACDWVNMLARMYSRWAESKGFEWTVTELQSGEEAGIRRLMALVRGPFAYGLLQSETGVHRLVRISPFDANARRHTSFASCDVIPEIEDDVEIEIKESDLKIDTYRSSGAGGQHVNKTESAVRLTHLPSGIVVACQNERSQMKNRALAFKILKAKLYEREQEKKRAAFEKRYDEKGEIAWGNQIRSYVFMPYQLVKDLRSDHETGNIQAVMDGEFDPFIEAYLAWKIKKK
jgi:peptide chain release factor 2